MKLDRLFLLFFLIVSISTSYGQNEIIKDFSNHHFKAEPIFSLSGTWEFYYGQLLSPGDFSNNDLNVNYIETSNSWHKQGDYPVLGYATYRCKVLLPKNQYGLLLFVPVINSASAIWINGVKRSTIGTVLKGPENFKTKLKNVYLSVPEFTETLEIVIHVSNYAYFSAGLVKPPLLGKSDKLIHNRKKGDGLKNFFIGCFIAMFLYQMFLYFLYEKGNAHFWLGMICLTVALRSMIIHNGSFFLPDLFPSVSYELWEKIEFISVYLNIAIFPLYIHYLFEKSFSKDIVKGFVINYLFEESLSENIVKGFVTLALFFGVAVIFTPQYIYGKLLDFSLLAILLTFVYAVITIVKAWRAGNSDAKIIFYGVLVAFPLILMEMLNHTVMFNVNFGFSYFLELGVLVFLFSQVYILTSEYTTSYKDLEIMNLEHANLQDELAQQNEALVESNKIKEQLLSVITHDVKGPLNSLKSLMSLFREKHMSKSEFDEYFKKVEGNLSGTTGLVDNILYWTANLRKGEMVYLEKANLNLLILDNINQLYPIAKNKSIQIAPSLPDDVFVYSDVGILNFVVRNLLSNAIKFSHKESTIEIVMEQTSEDAILSIIDHGLGMDAEQMELLFIDERGVSTEGTLAEKGTGLGLKLCKEFINKINGQISVKSTVEVGSTFTVSIPKLSNEITKDSME